MARKSVIGKRGLWVEIKRGATMLSAMRNKRLQSGKGPFNEVDIRLDAKEQPGEPSLTCRDDLVITPHVPILIGSGIGKVLQSLAFSANGQFYS